MSKIEITPGFLLLMSYLTFYDDMFIMFLTAALLHELAHIAATLLLGGSLVSCRLSMTGAFLRVDRLSYGGEAAAVFAGPVISIAMAFIASWFGWYMLAGANLSLGVYNLLPARDLDGGRLVELFFARRGIHASGILSVLTALSAAAISIPLAIAFTNGVRNYTMAIFAVSLLVGDLYGQFTNARAKARTLHGRRNRERLKRSG
ncbi:MAG: hypothetical protein FWG36_05130 [Oscillospiraceae bacterium]|nr:hypothetical protein [Oscillospiraceae bacterium]